MEAKRSSETYELLYRPKPYKTTYRRLSLDEHSPVNLKINLVLLLLVCHVTFGMIAPRLYVLPTK
jgi:hypothetical protein